MLPNNFDEALLEAVSTALERMAFMVGEPVPYLNGEVHHASSIDVRVDEAHYKVCVRATDGALQELLSGLIDAETFDEEQGQLAVRELANVLGGEVLRILGGDERPSKLGLPEDGPVCEETEQTVRTTLDFLGDTLEVAVTPRECAA